ncbi:MAG: dual specificity protein phosphatase family protein [Anaerolineae bacterium]|nr:dual specificity protein phosphatase family protein [Anaerolineae bacterium]
MSQPSDLPFPHTVWVCPSALLAGPYPAARDEAAARAWLRALLAAGIIVFVDLTEEGERPPYLETLREEAAHGGWGAVHYRLAIPDFSVPDEAHMAAILDTIDGAIAAGQPVYVHCLGGVGRTGTVVGCYLVRHGANGEEALRRVTALLGEGSPETEAQRRFVRRWTEGR